MLLIRASNPTNDDYSPSTICRTSSTLRKWRTSSHTTLAKSYGRQERGKDCLSNPSRSRPTWIERISACSNAENASRLSAHYSFSPRHLVLEPQLLCGSWRLAEKDSRKMTVSNGLYGSGVAIQSLACPLPSSEVQRPSRLRLEDNADSLNCHATSRGFRK